MTGELARVIAMLALAGLSLLGADTAAASGLTPEQAINVAGRQRMLTQRIVKAYAQVAQRITPQASLGQLRDAVRLFDRQLVDLKKSSAGGRGREPVARMERLWRPFRTVALGRIDRAGAERLLAMERDLHDAAHELTVALQQRSASASGRLINVSGRQRMLSQRLTKCYLLRAWGLESPAIVQEFGSTRAEFDGALAALRAAPENSAEIRRELDAVALQWEWFQNALKLDGAASYSLIVVSASEAILNSMEIVTGLYERLPSR